PSRRSMYSYFFFLAEDGIRARNVTGVQTCALPIADLESIISDTRVILFLKFAAPTPPPLPPSGLKVLAKAGFTPYPWSFPRLHPPIGHPRMTHPLMLHLPILHRGAARLHSSPWIASAG